MINFIKFSMFTGLVLLLVGCKTTSLSEQTFGKILTQYQNPEEGELATIVFSADKQFETEEGVPILGEPLICHAQRLQTTSVKNSINTSIQVKADEPVILTTLINWYNSGWTKSCWPLVRFIPKAGETYVLVNERVGGKGISALWTGVAFQSCNVSVYHLHEGQYENVDVSEVNHGTCSIK